MDGIKLRKRACLLISYHRAVCVLMPCREEEEEKEKGGGGIADAVYGTYDHHNEQKWNPGWLHGTHIGVLLEVSKPRRAKDWIGIADVV